MKKSQLKLFLKKIVTEARLLENVQDPTKDEMFNYLHQMYGNEEGFRDNAEVAVYWFANFYHGGQSSHLYSVLSTSRFHPGPMAKGPEPQSMEEMMYEDLVLKFAPGTEEATEIQKKHNSLNESTSIKNEAVSPKNQEKIERWIKELGTRKTAYKIIGSIVRQRTMMDIEDMADTATLASGIDSVEQLLVKGDFEQALRAALEAAKEFFDEEAGEGLFEGDEADAVNDMWAGSDDDLESQRNDLSKQSKKVDANIGKMMKDPSYRPAPFGNKQKSKKFFSGTNKPQKTVQDFDWERIKKGIDKGTLKEWGESEQVIYKDRQGGQDVYWMDNKDTGGKIQVKPEAVQKLIKRGHRLVDLQDVNEENTAGGGTSSLIDGQSNIVAASRVNKILAELSKGIFSDDSWQAINKIFEKLKASGLDYNILSAKYGGQQDTSNNMPKYKEWQISIPFTNKAGKPMELVGAITAHGAGSVEQPLDRYDITAYVSAIPKRG